MIIHILSIDNCPNEKIEKKFIIFFNNVHNYIKILKIVNSFQKKNILIFLLNNISMTIFWKK
jgi:hypothetical protein